MLKEDVATGFHYELYKNCLVVYVTQDLDHHAVQFLRNVPTGLLKLVMLNI